MKQKKSAGREAQENYFSGERKLRSALDLNAYSQGINELKRHLGYYLNRSGDFFTIHTPYKPSLRKKRANAFGIARVYTPSLLVYHKNQWFQN